MTRLPLEDVTVIDFTWVIAGPHSTKLLADLGARVIKIESLAKRDGLRGTGRTGGGNIQFEQENRNKLGVRINLRTEKGREVFERLVKIGDVVTCNFSADGFRKMGLEWDKLSKINPKIIVVNAPGLGNWGPRSDFQTFAHILQAMTGMTGMIGYPNQEPVGPGTPWIDYIGGASIALSVLAALEHRGKTGKGQFIDVSQQESALSLLGTSLLDWKVSGKTRENCGNRHPAAAAAPHGCYKCKGDDRWCVISVASDEEWENFCNVIGNLEWTKDGKFNTHLHRLNNEEELNELVEAWTINYHPEEVMEKMQEGGVSAGVVQNVEDLIKHDTHLRERGFLVEYDLPPDRRPPSSVVMPGVITRFSKVPLTIRCPSPTPGQDSGHVLKDILGMTQEEINEAEAGGALD